MKAIPIARLREKEPHRPRGYFDDVTSRGEIRDGILYLEVAVWEELKAKYADRCTICTKRQEVCDQCQHQRKGQGVVGYDCAVGGPGFRWFSLRVTCPEGKWSA